MIFGANVGVAVATSVDWVGVFVLHPWLTNPTKLIRIGKIPKPKVEDTAFRRDGDAKDFIRPPEIFLMKAKTISALFYRFLP
jgi:hypothetical protein